MRKTGLLMVALASVALVFSSIAVLAHCDTMEGPVVTTARKALEKGDVTPVLKWVKKDSEEQVKTLFAKTLIVRAKGAEAKELADMYFLETLVRLHRAGEGEPYTGLKSTPVEPIVAMADKALESGSVDEMTRKISNRVTEAIKEKFNKAMEARKHADESVEAGREYVEAYVQYMHYVEGLHTAVMAAGHHHDEASDGAKEPDHKE